MAIVTIRNVPSASAKRIGNVVDFSDVRISVRRARKDADGFSPEAASRLRGNIAGPNPVTGEFSDADSLVRHLRSLTR